MHDAPGAAWANSGFRPVIANAGASPLSQQHRKRWRIESLHSGSIDEGSASNDRKTLRKMQRGASRKEMRPALELPDAVCRYSVMRPIVCAT